MKHKIELRSYRDERNIADVEVNLVPRVGDFIAIKLSDGVNQFMVRDVYHWLNVNEDGQVIIVYVAAR